MSLRSASCITGTIKPLGVSAAKPIWKYFLKTRFSPVGSSDALNRGNFCNAAMQALMMNTSGVSFTPSCAALSLSAARTASRSVMSASSYCVTCGRLIQLACSRAPEIFWIRDSGLTSTAPNREKSTCATLGSPLPAAAVGAGALEHQDQRAFGDFVALFDLDLGDPARLGRRNVHGGLLGLEGDQRGLFLYLLTVLHKDFDDADILEAADVGNQDFDWCCHVCA